MTLINYRKIQVSGISEFFKECMTEKEKEEVCEDFEITQDSMKNGEVNLMYTDGEIIRSVLRNRNDKYLLNYVDDGNLGYFEIYEIIG